MINKYIELHRPETWYEKMLKNFFRYQWQTPSYKRILLQKIYEETKELKAELDDFYNRTRSMPRRSGKSYYYNSILYEIAQKEFVWRTIKLRWNNLRNDLFMEENEDGTMPSIFTNPIFSQTTKRIRDHQTIGPY